MLSCNFNLWKSLGGGISLIWGLCILSWVVHDVHDPIYLYSFAWLELVSHRMFMPKLLLINSQKGWPLVQRLLVALFKFMEPYLRNAELSDPVQCAQISLRKLCNIINTVGSWLLLVCFVGTIAVQGYIAGIACSTAWFSWISVRQPLQLLWCYSNKLHPNAESHS
mgnify:CR=1 FL=1